MPISFKHYIKHQERESFREQQFYQHILSRALSEAEWVYPEQLAEELLAEKLSDFPIIAANGTRQPIPHRSDDPNYDKEAAYRHYGSPTEDKVATAAAVQKHTEEHGKPPSKTAVNKLKVFAHDTNPKTAGGVSGIVRNYGAPDKTPITDDERKKEAESNFDKFSELRKSNPKEYRARVKLAQTKHKDGKLPLPLKNTTKGDTIADLRGDNDTERNGHVSLGFSGTPDERFHTTTEDGEVSKPINACHGKGNCVKNCLAKGGCGGFTTTKGHRGVYDQMGSHNAAARHDHDLLMYHQLYTMGRSAKRKGKGAVVRPDTTTGHQAHTHAEAIAKHFGSESELVKSGEIQKVKVNTYGKTTGTDKDTHNMNGQNINIAASDQGIPTSPSGVAAHQLLTAAMRQRGVPSATNQGSRIAFTVLQVKHPKTPEGMSDEDYITKAKHKDPQEQADYEKAKSVHTVRRYDLTHSTPKPGEPEEYHDSKTKSGRVLHGGKSYYYTDHDVPRPMETTEGKQQPTYMHDHRSGELARHHEENPTSHGINAVAMATSSTKMNKTVVGKSIFHPIKNIDNSGILHVMHPSTPEAAKAREIIGKSPQMK